MIIKIIVLLSMIILTSIFIAKIFANKKESYLAIIILFLILGLSIWRLIKNYGFSYTTFTYSLVIYSLSLISLSDIKYNTIPKDVLFINTFLGILLSFLNPNMKGIYTLLVTILIFIVLFILYKILKGAIGIGDIYIFTIIALILGWRLMIGIFIISLILTGIVSFFLLILKKANKSTKLPFSPFILCSTILLVLL